MNLQQLTPRGGWIVAALLLPFVASFPASAAAPLAKTSAPGYYRMMLGSFEVTALLDGTVDLPISDLMTNTTKAKVGQALARAHLKDPVETSVNAYLINTGDKLVMIDAGAGTFFGPTVGKLVANLKASGYQPEQIDEIYITHMHSDHSGGLVSDGKAVFPNAIVRADRRDAETWLDKAKMEAAPKETRPAFEGAMAAINPYVAAGKFKPFDGATQLVPGVSAVPAYGHTPGHSVYMVESQGQRLVVWGDLMHVGAVQFPEPAVT
ncbi:MAG: MBL fold metallo-hydrolase, partial [Burkholderiaceae bacterium]|nr:MBL fold metallo-hydrolase [Burkholderiaceae bacterium]